MLKPVPAILYSFSKEHILLSTKRIFNKLSSLWQVTRHNIYRIERKRNQKKQTTKNVKIGIKTNLQKAETKKNLEQ